jgi:hypothetical protein
MIPKAKKSGGPKSRSGKKIVSQNATKTGVYARSIVLPNEDKNAYQQLVNRYMNEFKPSDMAETTMVNNLANLTWKKMRLDHYEQNSLMAVWNGSVFLKDLEKEGLIRFPRDMSWLEIFAIFGKYMKEGLSDLEKQYAEYESEINQLYGQEPNVHYLQRFFGQSPKLLEQIQSVAKNEFSRKNLQVTELLQITYANTDDQTLLDACTNKILERKADIAWYQENREEIREAELQIKERRVMEKMQKTDFSRAHDELDRSFYRTLTELRKQQQWRREQNEVVVITSDQK